MLSKKLDIHNLHHAYLFEGTQDAILPKLVEFFENENILTQANPDFVEIKVDIFKIEDARNLKSLVLEKGISADSSLQSGKKIYIISANQFLLEAQNSLLKIFEEPTPHTHFFVITPYIKVLLPTFVSRFHIISGISNKESVQREVENFIQLPYAKRIDFIKELLTEPEDVLEEEPLRRGSSSAFDSPRVKALQFLNALESALHKKSLLKHNFDMHFFQNFFKARKFLHQPGSSAKTLMEGIALSIPEKM